MTAVQMPSTAPPGSLSAPALATERLVLRAPLPADAPAIAALAGNRKVAEMTASLPHPYRIEDAESWIAGQEGERAGVTFAILEAKTGAFVGVCGFGWHGGTAPEIGYWTGEPFWGHGYGTEAVRAMIDHAFTATELDALAASCRVTNIASRRVLEKCGFQWTGAGLTRVRALRSSVPSDRFRLERRIWASLRAWGKTRLPVQRETAAAPIEG